MPVLPLGMGNLKDGHVLISGVVQQGTLDLVERIKALTGWSRSAITGEVLTAWHEGRPPIIGGWTERELKARLEWGKPADRVMTPPSLDKPPAPEEHIASTRDEEDSLNKAKKKARSRTQRAKGSRSGKVAPL